VPKNDLVDLLKAYYSKPGKTGTKTKKEKQHLTPVGKRAKAEDHSDDEVLCRGCSKQEKTIKKLRAELKKVKNSLSECKTKCCDLQKQASTLKRQRSTSQNNTVPCAKFQKVEAALAEAQTELVESRVIAEQRAQEVKFRGDFMHEMLEHMPGRAQ
jgi:hypothetical protein